MDLVIGIYCEATEESFQLSLVRFPAEHRTLALLVLRILASLFDILSSRTFTTFFWVEELRLATLDGSTIRERTFRRRP